MTSFDPTLPEGWTISSRLMACFTLQDGSTVELDRDGRYVVTDGDGMILAEGDDYRPAAVHDWHEVCEPFLAFLTSDAESYRYHMGQDIPEDGYLFGERGAEWAYMNDSELDSERFNLQGEER